MSQLSKAPLRSAKHLKKVKEMKHVETAIKWHERARKKRQATMADAWESKQTVLRGLRWEKGNIQDVKRRALKEAREDWKLGPLRPNRAVGQEAQTYGAMSQEGMRRPPVPVRVQKNRNEVLEKQGKELKYPIVVDDKKYFHIVAGDRVVVIKGREQGKIGTVYDILPESHEVIVKDINKAYADGSIWNTPTEDAPPPKREADTPIHLADVRLVVPYRITTQNAAGHSKEILQDVIVDKLVMERHTTGIDPFTDINYGKDEFPKEHRFDPETGLPIFKRYIAGTRSIVQWPWEFDPEEHKGIDQQEESSSDVKSEAAKGRLRRSIDWVKSTSSTATKAVLSSTKKREEELERKKQEQDDRELLTIEKGIQEAQEQPYPKSKEERVQPDSDDDTGRNYAEVTPETRSFYPTLVYPPFPNELSTELAQDIRIQSWADAKDKSGSNTTGQDLARKFREKKEAEERVEVEKLEVMKTPMQLRWEVEREKKLREEKPLVQTEALLLALGSHMQANGIKLTPKRMKAAGEEVHVD